VHASAEPWSSFAVGSRLRRYQRRAVDEVVSAFEHRDRICLVAPPGAGKTHCALHVAAALGRPTEVRVPTTALVEQWEARVRENVVLGDGPPPIRVKTYAGLGEFAPGALLVLDEAHHLGGAWGRDVTAAMEAAGDCRVLGLTGTPPFESKAWAGFSRLMGDDPVRIDTPPLVRDRHLCPYQDLAWPVLADDDCLGRLRAAGDSLRAVETSLGRALEDHLAVRLREDLWELTEARFAARSGLLVALCRVHRAAQGRLPLDLPADPEFEAAPTLHDRARVLWDFGADRDDVRAAVREAGFRPAGKGLVLHDDVGHRILADGAARLRGLHEVLGAEAAHRTDAMRALVLVDRDREGARLSARRVLKSLVADRATDRLDPILVTGSVFWVDDDVWPRVAPRLPDLPWRVAGDHHEVDVTAWPTARRVAVATQLLSDGVTRCLVGTHHLLGEGWDCPAVNVVADLTGIVASVTINQVRGRGLRCDPADPAKVASLWDIVTVAPGVAGGDRMLQRLATRHEHTLGIDPKGRIRAGVERIDPALLGSAEAVARAVPHIRERMVARVRDEDRAADLWAVGKDYRDRRVWRMERPTDVPVAGGARPDPKKKTRAAAKAWAPARSRRTGLRVVSAIVGSVTATSAGLAAAAGVGGIAPFAAVGAAAWVLGAEMFFRRRPLEDRREAEVRALHAALVDAGLVEGDVRREGDAFWLDGDPEHSRRFAEAAVEVLGRIRFPRYVLLEDDGSVRAVPSALAGDRELADAFARRWAEHVAGCEAVFARRGRGRELLVEAWKLGGTDASLVEAWE